MTDAPARIFDRPLVDAFSTYSGDLNPIHVDEIEARRLLYGTCVVHGVLLVLWALAIVAERKPTAIALERLKASFKSPVFVGDAVSADVTSDGDDWCIRLRRGGRLAARIDVTTTSPGTARHPSTIGERPVCRTLADDEIGDAAGSVPLTDADATAIFPALDRVAPDQLAAVAATSRIVGMECPGRHSLFSDFKLSFTENDGNAVAYRVERWDPRFRIVTLSLSGAATGEATAFVRPAPVGQPSTASLIDEIDDTLFPGASALIVGGSRGLGELLAKLLAAAGASITVTYASGRDDAESVARDINETFPGRADTAPFDVLTPSPAELNGPYSHVFYCASPKILAETGKADDAATDGRYERYYSTALRETLEAISSVLRRDATVVNLSSVFAENPPPAFHAYGRAKAASETVCLDVAKVHGLRGVNWRLPRLPTDQTQSLTAETFDDPVDILAGNLKALATGRRS